MTIVYRDLSPSDRATVAKLNALAGRLEGLDHVTAEPVLIRRRFRRPFLALATSADPAAVLARAAELGLWIVAAPAGTFALIKE